MGDVPDVDAVPPHAALLRDFANTYDVRPGTDVLASPDVLAGWLSEHGLVAPGSRPVATDADLADARQLRGGLRAMMADETAAPELDELLGRLSLRLTFRPDGPGLRPAAGGVSGGLASLLVAAVTAVADGSWERLKICPADDCRWAFYDASKNRSRTWCDMQVCGNRKKTRAYRARNRTSA